MRWKRIAIGFAALLVLSYASKEVLNWGAHELYEFHSTQIRSAAEKAVGPEANLDDARDWLRLAGYESVPADHDYSMWQSGFSSDSDTTKYRVILGQRQFVPQTWLLDAKWLQVSFLFKPSGEFQRVETDLWPMKMEFPSVTTSPTEE